MLAQLMRRVFITGPETLNHLAYFEVCRT